MEDLPDIVQTLEKQLKRIFIICNFILFPILYVILIVQMDFRVLSRSVFSIVILCLLLLMDAGMVALYLIMSRPIRRFTDEWKSSEGNLAPEALDRYWESLTRLPVKMGIWAAALVPAIFLPGALFLHFMGMYDLRQTVMMSCAALWFSLFSGMAFYTRTKSTLGPALTLIHGRRPVPWKGRRIGFAVKMIFITVLISIFPLIEISLQVERWNNESIKKLYQETIISDLNSRAALMNSLWAQPALPPDAFFESGKYFLLTEDDNRRNAAGLKVQGWEIPLPGYFAVPLGNGMMLGRRVKPDEWKPYTRKVRFTVLIFFIFFAAFSLAMGYIFGRIVGGSTTNMTNLARDIARSQAFRYQHIISYSDDEEGDLALAFNDVLGIIQKQFGLTESLLERIREAVAVLGSSSSEMRAVADNQAGDSQAQAGRVAELAGTGAEIAAAAQQITEKSGSVKQAAESTLDWCREGNKRIENAVNQITEANKRAGEMVERMGSLEERFAEIEKVVETIAGVSDKTELISMNAALEAAGARKYGKRFGVVAAEVKRLAIQIRDMTTNIRSQLANLRDTLHGTAFATRESAGAVLEGVNGMVSLRENLDQLSTTAERTYTTAVEISVSTREQTQASERLADTLNEISDLAKQVASRSEESRKAIEDITRMALNLNDILWSADSPAGESPPVF